MIIVKTLKDLTLMRNILQKELPQSITVLGGLLHILNNNSCHLEMCVDSWPTFSAAICYRQKQRFRGSSSSEVMPDICAIFTKKPETLRSLQLNESVVHWRSELIFRGSDSVPCPIYNKGIPSTHCHLIKELASLRGLDITEYGGYNTFIHHDPTSMDWQEKVFPLPVSILDGSHAELVDAHLPYGGSRESLNHVRACIRHLPNHCMRNKEGRPVSWMMSDELCELRMAYTLPEYRRAGHLLALSVAQICRMSSAGLPIYCHVNQQNQATINAVMSLGFLLVLVWRTFQSC